MYAQAPPALGPQSSWVTIPGAERREANGEARQVSCLGERPSRLTTVEPFLTAFQSHCAECHTNTNAWPMGLCDPSEPTLRGSTTGEGLPAVVKCGVCANADDVDADEDEESGTGMMGRMFVAKRAVCVHSACCLLGVRDGRLLRLQGVRYFMRRRNC